MARKSRLFLAIETDEVKDLKFPGIRPANSFHLTLKFIGDAYPEDIIKKLERIEYESFDIVIEGTGAFPDSKRPRVLFLSVNGDGLHKLKQKIDKMLDIPEEHSFRPHITVARVREPNEEFLRTQFSPITKRVDKFFLYESVLTPQGAIHKKLKEFSASHS